MKVNTNDTDNLFVNGFAKSILLILKNFVFDILISFQKSYWEFGILFHDVSFCFLKYWKFRHDAQILLDH